MSTAWIITTMIKTKINENPYHRNRKAHCLPILHFILAATCIVANLGYFNCRNYRLVLSLEIVFVFMTNTWGKGNMCQYECKYKDVFSILAKTWTGKEGKGKMKTVASNVRQYEWGAASLKIPAHSHTMASPGNMSIFAMIGFLCFQTSIIVASGWIWPTYVCMSSFL